MAHPDTERYASEKAIIVSGQSAVSDCNWEIGRVAAIWNQQFARGRTSKDFGDMLQMSGGQIRDRVKVFVKFAVLRGQFCHLLWQHFLEALDWDDSEECLAWANENSATVAEMKAWRRLQRGEDVTEENTAARIS